MPKAQLIVEDGELKGKIFSLDEGTEWSFGTSDEENTFPFDAEGVAINHFLLTKKENSFFLKANDPLKVNGEQVETTPLKGGDLIEINGHKLRFLILKNEGENPPLGEEKKDSQQIFSEDSLEEEEEPFMNEDPAKLKSDDSLVEEEPPLGETRKRLKSDESLVEEEPFMNEDPAKLKSDDSFLEEEPPLGQRRKRVKRDESLVEEEPFMNEDPAKLKSDEFLVEEEPPLGQRRKRVKRDESSDEDSSDEIDQSLIDEDTLFEEEKDDLADLNFDLMGTGRYLLKVVGGPNNGAEFSMHADATYVIGTDPLTCDVVFHDKSVSRQHLKIFVDHDNHLFIEDLNSRNGVFVDNQKLTSKKPLEIGQLVSLGTSSFILFDREGEMHTIISPPFIQEPKELPVTKEIKEEPSEPQEEIQKTTKEVNDALQMAVKETLVKEARDEKKTNLSTMALFGLVSTILVLTGLALSTLFQEAKPIELSSKLEPEKALQEALTPFPSVRFSFNQSTGKLFLVGNVSSPSDRNQLLYNLQGLHFLSAIDSSGVIVDEFVWREINQVLNRNKSWRGITIQSSAPGQYIISGTLKTRKQAEELSDYVASNFPYLDKLENRIIVEEDVINTVTNELKINRLSNLQVEISNGLLTLTGSVGKEQKEKVNALIEQFKKIEGVRSVKSFISELAPESKLIDISDKFTVSGVSQVGSTISVIINGKILSKGDTLNGMNIVSITRNEMRLTKDGVEYRINFK
jgi:type III secretion system YscD/HrpQ family protein